MLNEQHQIVLGGIADEAALHASASLTKLAGKPVKVEISQVGERALPDLPLEEMVSGVLLPVTGDVHGNALLIFPEKIACALCDLLQRREIDGIYSMSLLDQSALKEVGNILCGNFLTVFSNALQIKLVENVPLYCFDMFGAVIDNALAESVVESEDSLVIQVKFTFEDQDISGFILLILGMAQMNAIEHVLAEH